MEEPLPKSEPVHREKIIVQVKGGGVNRGDVASLLGDVENQKAAGGVLITLEKPSKQMRTEAADAGRYTSKLWHDKDCPRIQILTVEGLLSGAERVEAPPANQSIRHGCARIIAREANRDAVTNRGSDSWWKCHCGTQACSKFAIARTRSPARVTRALSRTLSQ
jgi:hypothetical protein